MESSEYTKFQNIHCRTEAFLYLGDGHLFIIQFNGPAKNKPLFRQITEQYCTLPQGSDNVWIQTPEIQIWDIDKREVKWSHFVNIPKTRHFNPKWLKIYQRLNMQFYKMTETKICFTTRPRQGVQRIIVYDLERAHKYGKIFQSFTEFENVYECPIKTDILSINY